MINEFLCDRIVKVINSFHTFLLERRLMQIEIPLESSSIVIKHSFNDIRHSLFKSIAIVEVQRQMD